MRRNNSSEGVKICYQCKVNCPKSAYILCHNNELKATIFLSKDEHAHEVNQRGLPDDVKSKINQLFKDGVKKPNLIIDALELWPLRNQYSFTKNQLCNYLRTLKNEVYGQFTISLKEENILIKNR